MSHQKLQLCAYKAVCICSTVICSMSTLMLPCIPYNAAGSAQLKKQPSVQLLLGS